MQVYIGMWVLSKDIFWGGIKGVGLGGKRRKKFVMGKKND